MLTLQPSPPEEPANDLEELRVFGKDPESYPHFPDQLNQGFLDWAKEACGQAGQRVEVKTDSPKGGRVYITELPCFGEALVLLNPTTGHTGRPYRNEAAFYDTISGEKLQSPDDVDMTRNTAHIATTATLVN